MVLDHPFLCCTISFQVLRKGTRLLAGAGKTQGDLEHFIVPPSKEVLKKQTGRGHDRGHRHRPERAPKKVSNGTKGTTNVGASTRCRSVTG